VESIPQRKIHITRQRKAQTPLNCSYEIITTAERQIHVGRVGSMWRNYTHTPLQMAGKVMANNHYNL